MPYSRLFAMTAIYALTGCQMPPGPPDPTGRADADMLRVLTAYQASGAKPVQTLAVAQARDQPSIEDAAASVARQEVRPTQPHVARVYDTQVQGATGPLAARVYDPQTTRGPAPVILFFHGGGWVLGNLDTEDATDRVLANSTGAIVLSVAYRLAPEARFPAAQDDAAAAYKWLVQNAASIGGNSRALALAGESAGGNLAIDTAAFARDTHLRAPIHELLVYPVVGTDLHTPSYEQNAAAVPLGRAAMEWFLAQTTNGPDDLRDPRLNVVGAAELRDLPPTTIVSADIDPLRSENVALSQKLKASGVDVQQRTFRGVTHEFFSMGVVVPQAREAETFAAGRLLTSFSQAPPAPAPAHHRRRTHRSS